MKRNVLNKFWEHLNKGKSAGEAIAETAYWFQTTDDYVEEVCFEPGSLFPRKEVKS